MEPAETVFERFTPKMWFRWTLVASELYIYIYMDKGRVYRPFFEKFDACGWVVFTI